MIRNLSSSPIVLQDIGSPRSYIISQHASQVYLPDKALTDSLQRATMIVDITAAACDNCPEPSRNRHAICSGSLTVQ